MAADGVAEWSSPAWLDEATTWLDASLAAAGRARSGPVEQVRIRPWATVLRAPTRDGDVWLKAAGAGTRFEVGLYELLAEAAPEHVLGPIAVDVERAWALLPDGGPPLSEDLDDPAVAAPLGRALVAYGEVQRALQPQVPKLRALGVEDMTPGRMVERFHEALDVTAGASDPERHRAVAAMEPTVARWCEELAASSLAPSLDHNDLHPLNVLGSAADGFRFYDWGDAVLAHPFAALLMPLRVVRHALGCDTSDPRYVRIRDTYVAGFGPVDELVGEVEVACSVAKIARALVWERAVASARDAGEEVDPDFATAPWETLTGLLAPEAITDWS